MIIWDDYIGIHSPIPYYKAPDSYAILAGRIPKRRLEGSRRFRGLEFRV